MVGEQVVIAVKCLLSAPPGNQYVFWLEPEPGLPPVPHGDKGLAAGLEHPMEFTECLKSVTFFFDMVVGSHGYSPVK